MISSKENPDISVLLSHPPYSEINVILVLAQQFIFSKIFSKMSMLLRVNIRRELNLGLETQI